MRRTAVFVFTAFLMSFTAANGQTFVHGPGSGIAHGVPDFCATPTVTSVASGAWSDGSTWSTGRVPGADDKVRVASGTIVTYDSMGAAPLSCINVAGRLTFRTAADTLMKVGTITVLQEGTLEIGTEARPVASNVTAEIIVVDRPIDTTLDPDQLSTGLVGLGTVTIHGAVKTPTFGRLAAEPLAGATTLRLERPVTSWNVGDKLVLPDTRQLRQNERGTNYEPQWEELTIAAIAGDTITVAAPLAFDHRGARGGDGVLELLPHVGNLSRNVVFRSENPEGTRGHAIFMQHPTVDIRYALFKDMGRTKIGVLDNAQWNADGTIRSVGTNQIGRYSIHFHHSFGPTTTPASGYQFTLIGNAVDDASKWGITVHNSHYGLVRENVVYNSRGAGIVTEDGTESFNVFERNFAIRSEGSGEFAPRSGYGGATNDPGGEGAGFWLRGPNNILRDNVAANVDVFGYGIAAGSLGMAPIPRFKGADTSKAGEFDLVDTTETPVMEFTGNEAYGAIQTGVAIGWNATLTSTRVWHTSRHALTAFPADRLVVDDFIGRGDPAVLQGQFENPTGIWFTNYAAKTVTVRNANIQGMRVGVASPFFAKTDLEPGRGDGIATIENSYFRDYVGVAVATAYSPSATTAAVKKAVIRNTEFASMPDVPAAISMNYGMSAGDTERRDPVVVYDFNRKPGDTFRVFYSHQVPASAAPACNAARPEIGGFLCAGDDAIQETRQSLP